MHMRNLLIAAVLFDGLLTSCALYPGQDYRLTVRRYPRCDQCPTCTRQRNRNFCEYDDFVLKIDAGYVERMTGPGLDANSPAIDALIAQEVAKAKICPHGYRVASRQWFKALRIGGVCVDE
jgi:hypothetical protein